MGISNTPSKPPFWQMSNEMLLEELDLSLRRAASMNAAGFAAEIKDIHQEITRRDLDLATFLDRLNLKTGWQMDQFLTVILAGDQTSLAEYDVRLLDGSSLHGRCWHCGKHDRRLDTPIWLCDFCLQEALNSTRSRNENSSFMVFRSYSPSRRCRHATSETVMVMSAEDDFWNEPLCEQCLLDEIDRRHSDKPI